MILKKYSKFRSQMILESIIRSTPELQNLLYRIYNKDYSQASKIAMYLYKLASNSVDVKTNYNALNLADDKNDEISFIPDSQFQRYVSKAEDPWAKTKSKSKVGRMIKQILKDNDQNYTDKEIEEFVNYFKAEWDRVKGVNKKIEVVTGSKISFWYNSENYLEQGGTLGNSCMKSPDKNDYLDIYANNPDTISLVILTDEGKLIARALLWKLTSSSLGKTIYLDRIYTLNDSDQQFVNNWVFENIAKNDEKIYSSHYKRGRENNAMTVDLKKVIFDTYPYADTMVYLYKKVDNGVLLGNGYISNDRNDNEYKDYVIYILQNTNGGSEYISHKYSEKLKIFIPNSEALYLFDEHGFKDWYNKSDAVYNSSRGEWYLKSNAIFSEKMNQWISKKDSIDHPEFGIILRSWLVTVITEYKGNDNDPIKISSELNRRSSVEGNPLFTTISMLRNSNAFFKPYTSNHIFSNSLKVRDVYGNDFPIFLCYKLYKSVLTRINSGDKVINILGVHEIISGSYYITEIDSKFYNIPIDINEVKYIYYSDALRNISYSDYEDERDDYKVSEDIRESHDKYMESIHKYLLNSSSDYKRKYGFKKINKYILNPAETLIEISNKSADDAINELYNGLEACIRDEFYSTKDVKLLSLIKHLVKPFLLFYLIYNDSSNARYELVNFIDNKYPQNGIPGDIYQKVKTIGIEYLRYNFKDQARYYYNELLEKINISDYIDIDDYIRTLRSDDTALLSNIYELYDPKLPNY